MTETLDISLLRLGLIYLLLLLPLILLKWEGINFFRPALIGAGRMSIQLALVAIYLGYLFHHNSLLLNILWLMVMLGVTVATTIKRARLSLICFWPSITIGTTIGTLIPTLFLLMAVVQTTPIYDARYFIPFFGMILGNALRTNIISLERFYSGLQQNEKEYLTSLMLGASSQEATQPFLQQALKSALSPALAGMASIGLISLPGMMTGQILGGSLPMTAIKYQIAIIITIFTSETLSALLNLKLSQKNSFTPERTLKSTLFPRV